MKKDTLRSFVIIIIAQLFSLGLFAQSIYFNYIDGTNSAYILEDVRKITFESDLMNLHLLDGSIYSWNVSTIGYYEYNETPQNIEVLINKANTFDVVIFPNPTNGDLKIKYNLPTDNEIRIELYDLKGKLIFNKNIGKQMQGQQETILNLSQVPSGTYFCNIIGEKYSISKRIVKQ